MGIDINIKQGRSL